MTDQKLTARDLLGIAPDAQVAVRAGADEAIRADERAKTLAEVDALLHDGLRFDQWTARIPHPGRPGYVFADERRYLARFIAEQLGSAKQGGEQERGRP